MSVSGISLNTNSYLTDSWQDKLTQVKDAAQKLGQALKSGDLTSAQQVLASLQKLLPSSSGSQAQSSTQSTLATDVSALGEALQSGDLSKAKDAYATLQKDMQAARKHHHYSGAAESTASDSTTSNTDQTDVNINISSFAGGNIDILT